MIIVRCIVGFFKTLFFDCFFEFLWTSHLTNLCN